MEWETYDRTNVEKMNIIQSIIPPKITQDSLQPRWQLCEAVLSHSGALSWRLTVLSNIVNMLMLNELNVDNLSWAC